MNARLLVYELAITIASQMIRPALRIQRKRGRPLQRRSTHLAPFRVMKIKRLLRLVAWDIRTSNHRNNRPLPVRVPCASEEQPVRETQGREQENHTEKGDQLSPHLQGSLL